MSVSVRYMVLGPVQTNVYFVINDETKHCFITDPADRADVIIDQLSSQGLTPDAVLLTHCHYDHIGAVGDLKAHYGSRQLPVYAMEAEAKGLKDGRFNLSLRHGLSLAVEADVLLQDGQAFSLAGIKLQAFHTPGHTAGGGCYYIKESNLLLSGDTLFRGSVGRSDFPDGDGELLIKSIQSKLMPLPDETNVLPGHGGMTTIGFERANNPYL